MDIEIVIKGGEELGEHYPKKFDTVEDKISNMFLNRFPEVTGTVISRELSPMAQLRERKWQEAENLKFKNALIEVLKEPEFQEKIHKTIKSVVSAVVDDETRNHMRELYNTDPEFKARVDRYLELPASTPDTEEVAGIPREVEPETPSKKVARMLATNPRFRESFQQHLKVAQEQAFIAAFLVLSPEEVAEVQAIYPTA